MNLCSKLSAFNILYIKKYCIVSIADSTLVGTPFTPQQNKGSVSVVTWEAFSAWLEGNQQDDAINNIPNVFIKIKYNKNQKARHLLNVDYSDVSMIVVIQTRHCHFRPFRHHTKWLYLCECT